MPKHNTRRATIGRAYAERQQEIWDRRYKPTISSIELMLSRSPVALQEFELAMTSAIAALSASVARQLDWLKHQASELEKLKIQAVPGTPGASLVRFAETHASTSRSQQTH